MDCQTWLENHSFLDDRTCFEIGIYYGHLSCNLMFFVPKMFSGHQCNVMKLLMKSPMMYTYKHIYFWYEYDTRMPHIADTHTCFMHVMSLCNDVIYYQIAATCLSKWIQMNPNESKWIQMNPNDRCSYSICICLVLFPVRQTQLPFNARKMGLGVLTRPCLVG